MIAQGIVLDAGEYISRVYQKEVYPAGRTGSDRRPDTAVSM